MMHRARSSIVEVPYCFSRSSIKFQGHTALKIVEFDPKWAFPDCNSSLNSPMAMKCCTKLETAKERCPIFFQGQPSNFKVTRYKTSPILTQIGRFRTIGQSQLSNPSDLPCSNFGAILTQWNRSNLGVPGISRRNHEGNDLKFCTLMYLDHLQIWLVLGHSLLIFSCDQAALWVVFSVCLSVRHTFLTMFPSSYHHEIFRSYHQGPG